MSQQGHFYIMLCYNFQHGAVVLHSYKVGKYLDESRVLQYSSNVKHNLAVQKAFAKVMKMRNHTGLWDAKLTWYFHQICFYALEHGLRIPGSWPTWLCLIVTVLFNISKISWIIWLLYFDQLCHYLLYNKCFWLFLQHNSSAQLSSNS